MNEDEMAAVNISRSAFESTANCLADMKRQIKVCRDLNAKAEHECKEFRYARMTGQCQSTLDSLMVGIEVLEEIVKGGISAATYLTGDE